MWPPCGITSRVGRLGMQPTDMEIDVEVDVEIEWN